MADFMGCCTPEMKRRSGGPRGSERRMEDHHAVGCGRATGELRITEQPTSQLANPHVEIPVSRPSVRTASCLGLHRIVATERSNGCLSAIDSCGGSTVRIDIGEEELDPRIRGQRQKRRRCVVHVWVGAAEITVENVDLAVDLPIGDILLGCVLYDVYDDGNASYAGALGNFGVVCIAQRQVLDFIPGLRIGWEPR